MRKRLLLLPSFVLLIAIGLSACGGGDDETGKVEEAIETSVASTDPADCKKLQTQQFMEQVSGESGKAAMTECEDEAKREEGAKSATVSEVEVDGSDATAEAALEGGTLGGQTVEVALVDEDGQWKLNEVIRFTEFHQDKLVDFFKEEFIDPSSEIPRQLGSCIVEAVAESSQAEVEKLIFGGSRKPFEEIAEACQSSSGA